MIEGIANSELDLLDTCLALRVNSTQDLHRIPEL